MKRKDAQTVGDFIAGFLEDSQLGEKLKESRLIRAWGDLLGESVAQYTLHLHIAHQTLYVQLSSSVLRQELFLCRHQLVERLNRAAGGAVITNIVFK